MPTPNSAAPMTGKEIKGYRTLSPAEIEMMNDLKATSRKFIEQLAIIHGAPDTTMIDKNWLEQARTSMQNACMQACRAVAKPDNDC